MRETYMYMYMYQFQATQIAARWQCAHTRCTQIDANNSRLVTWRRGFPAKHLTILPFKISSFQMQFQSAMSKWLYP